MSLRVAEEGPISKPLEARVRLCGYSAVRAGSIPPSRGYCPSYATILLASRVRYSLAIVLIIILARCGRCEAVASGQRMQA